MLLRHAIGHVLRARRRELGKTLREVADAGRISLPYLSEVERGRKEPSSEIIEAICQALRIEVDELLRRAAGTLAGRDVAARVPAVVVLDLVGSTAPQPSADGATRGSVRLAA
ncbi:helix-turn-helix domain-containing protein [Lysobacter korlensis]|uniref:Helix-turn-helix domain-containing protein n=1 Tax=Lysobacter korlensis TaxID=553636 RepID=A0ABV6S1Q9_9GAMM